VIKKKAENFPEIYRPYNRNTAHVEFKNNSETSNKRGKWNHLKSIQKILQQPSGKDEIKEIKRKQSNWHCKRASVINTIYIYIFINSFSILSDDRSKASSKTILLRVRRVT